MNITMNKKYKTRDGQVVKVLYTERYSTDHKYSVVALVGIYEVIEVFTKCGQYSATGEKSPLDLIEVSEWDDFKIDDLVLFRNHGGFWLRGYFAGVSATGKPQTWDNGRTSWTEKNVCSRDECRRPTEEELMPRACRRSTKEELER